jgi:hypothetical protein
MHSPSSRRSPPDGGRDAREVGSVIERTLPVTLPVIVVAVSRWDCGPVGMRASRERLAFSMSVFVSFRGRPRGKKISGAAIRQRDNDGADSNPRFWFRASRRCRMENWMDRANISGVIDTRVFRAPRGVETKPSSARRHSERHDRRARAPVDVGGCASGLGYPSCRDRRRRWCRSSASTRASRVWEHHPGRRDSGRGVTRVVSVGGAP